ncbi:MAG: M6 family metalloprotease domain-containing protein [Candidatus Zixiibacteriota bacterium]
MNTRQTMRHATVWTLLGLLVMFSSAAAVAPTPEAIEKWKREGVWEQVVASRRAFKASGGCSPEKHSIFNKDRRRAQLAAGVNAVQNRKAIVILVEFSDWRAADQTFAATPDDFRTLLFSDSAIDSVVNPTGSMTDYYKEVSYGSLYLDGGVVGWYMMPHTYSYYVSTDHGQTRGAELARDAVNAAVQDGVDFSQFDQDNDFNIDGLIIVHAGPGAEEGFDDAIWSHKSQISPEMTLNGVRLSAYTMNPEEENSDLVEIGVFCHEFGHFLALPDLYDINDKVHISEGLGRWALMASGNQLNQSRSPSHMSAWSKWQAGFLALTTLNDTNLVQAEIAEAEFNPVAYRLKNDLRGFREYWIIENRQKVGFDRALPGSGLLIYHVDIDAPGGGNNADPNHYAVALEQADGKNDLALTLNNRGDPSDPWPGSSNAREFHNLTVPNSRTNITDLVTQIGVWNISNSDSLMYADLDVKYSRPYMVLTGDSIRITDAISGDGDSTYRAGETVSLFCTVKNEMLGAFNPRLSLQTSNPDIVVTLDSQSMGTFLGTGPVTNLTAVEFRLHDTLVPVIDLLTLVVSADSLSGGQGAGAFRAEFDFDISLGEPQILIVDDDRGADYQAAMENALYQLKLPSFTWDKSVRSSPTSSDLLAYSHVFWFTGDSAVGALSPADVAAMQALLDGGHNLFLSTISGVADIDGSDSTFLANYFGSVIAEKAFSPWVLGEPGSAVGDGTEYRYTSQSPRTYQQTILPINGGEIEFQLKPNGLTPGNRIVGISQSAGFKSMLMTFPLEFIDETDTYNRVDMFEHVLSFFGGISTDINDGTPFEVNLPRSFDLNQNYPNPFNPTTTISYTLIGTGTGGPTLAPTRLAVYNLLGREVKVLVDEIQSPGFHSVQWDGSSGSGQQVATGVYFYRLEHGAQIETKKMVLLK